MQQCMLGAIVTFAQPWHLETLGQLEKICKTSRQAHQVLQREKMDEEDFTVLYGLGLPPV